MQYALKEYWEERYQKNNEPFEWFQSFPDLKEVISANIPKEFKILHIGCGSSELAAQMVAEGWSDIVNVDFSSTIINVLKKRYAGKPELSFVEMDIGDMNFAAGSIDAVLDKACLDSILCCEEAQKQAEKIIAQIYKVLRPGGMFLLVATNHSETKLKMLERTEFEWNVIVEAIPKPGLLNLPLDDDVSYHYVFICRKATGVVYH